jgi:hypothetical protein
MMKEDKPKPMYSAMLVLYAAILIGLVFTWLNILGIITLELSCRLLPLNLRAALFGQLERQTV